MSNLLNLDLLDADGAIRESAEAAGLDRSDFLKKGVLAGGGLIAGSALFSQLGVAEAAISTKKSKKNDVKILNYALTLEFLEAAFYKQAVANKAYADSAALKRFAEVVANHEAKHVAFLKTALGSSAIKSPTFDFGKAVTDKATFAATAQILEDTGVSAYLGQVTRVFQPAVLARRGHDRHGRGASRVLDPLHQRRDPGPVRRSTGPSPRRRSSRPSAPPASSSSTARTGCARGGALRGPAVVVSAVRRPSPRSS